MNEKETKELLEQAQINYGYNNQIVVAIEELCELGAVLSKYPRYSTHEEALEKLRKKVLEETADVTIILQHIQMIFGIDSKELEQERDKKLNRLKRWLNNEDKSFQHTTEDRAIDEDFCDGCYYWEHIDEAEIDTCSKCIERRRERQ